MNLNELYTQIITENSRSKENRHPVEGATHSLEGVNPSCGDDITLQLRVKDGKIEDAGFIGSGCAISQASASLMIDLVKGRTVEDAHRLISLYFQMIKGKITPEELDDLEDVPLCRASPTSPPVSSAPCWHGTPWKKRWTAKARPIRLRPRIKSNCNAGALLPRPCHSHNPRKDAAFRCVLFSLRPLFFSSILWYNIQIYKLKFIIVPI